MAKIGWGEFIVILVIALLVLGPKKLPQAMQALGKAIRSVKKYIHETTQELEDIDDFKDIKNDVDGIRKDLRNMGSNIENAVSEDAENLETDLKKTAQKIETVMEKQPEQAVKTVPDVPAESDESTVQEEQTI